MMVIPRQKGVDAHLLVTKYRIHANAYTKEMMNDGHSQTKRGGCMPAGHLRWIQTCTQVQKICSFGDVHELNIKKGYAARHMQSLVYSI